MSTWRNLWRDLWVGFLTVSAVGATFLLIKANEKKIWMNPVDEEAPAISSLSEAIHFSQKEKPRGDTPGLRNQQSEND